MLLIIYLDNLKILNEQRESLKAKKTKQQATTCIVNVECIIFYVAFEYARKYVYIQARVACCIYFERECKNQIHHAAI